MGKIKKEDVEYIKKNYENESDPELADKLGIPTKRVYCIRKKERLDRKGNLLSAFELSMRIPFTSQYISKKAAEGIIKPTKIIHYSKRNEYYFDKADVNKIEMTLKNNFGLRNGGLSTADKQYIQAHYTEMSVQLISEELGVLPRAVYYYIKAAKLAKKFNTGEYISAWGLSIAAGLNYDHVRSFIKNEIIIPAKVTKCADKNIYFFLKSDMPKLIKKMCANMSYRNISPDEIKEIGIRYYSGEEEETIAEEKGKSIKRIKSIIEMYDKTIDCREEAE